MENPGERLKKIRLEKGISLEEVQKKTKIHLNILKSIEGDGLTDLSPVYLKGFLKIYCKFLGVDPKEYIPDYKETPSSAKYMMPGDDKTQEGGVSFFESAVMKLRTLRPSIKVKRAIVLIVAVFLVAVILFELGKFISSKVRFRSAKQTVALPPQTVKKAKAKGETAAAKNKATVDRTKSKIKETKAKKEVTSAIRLGIRARENCWVSLKVDGHVVFHRILEKGRFETWTAKNKMELSLGNAQAVELEVNGQLFTNLGRKGQVLKSIVITKEGLNIAR